MPNTSSTGIMNSVYQASDWLKTRFNNIDLFDEHYEREAKTNPFYALGSIFYMVWFIVMATGCLLIMWYIPTKAGAYDSILNIQHHIPLGGIIRGMHKYGADAMIIAATLRVFRMFLAADYKPGKEFNIALGLVALLLSMYSGLTGYLLIWNQRAFWATKVFATFPTYMDQFPVMGDFYLPLIKSLHLGWNTAEFLLGGGGAITQNTITRFFSLHLAFSLIPLMLVELYFYKTDFKRINLTWPKRIVVTMMLVITAIILPAAQGGRANPEVTPLPILSDWYFLGLYQMYKYLEPVVATEITMVIPPFVMLLPFMDVTITGPEKDIWKRPFIFMTAVMGGVCWVIFSGLIIVNIANIHNDPPYWRDFLYVLPNIGIIWQLILYWQTTNPMEMLKHKAGCVVMGSLAAIQSVLALVFFYMARTDMFFSPLTQSFAYWMCRGFMGGSADKAEALVAKAHATNIPYWNYVTDLTSGKPLPDKQLLVQIQEVAKTSSPIDFIFQVIPTFVDNVRYNGLVDYMVTNRWCFDYLTFCDRMNGKVATFPMNVPDLDWVWMIMAPIVVLLCAITYLRCDKAGKAGIAEKAKPAEPAAAAS